MTQLSRKTYEKELLRLQTELVKLQEWVRAPGTRLVVVFEGRNNRAGVEQVTGFCTQEEYRLFLRQCPIFEQMLVAAGVSLRKYWFSVSDAEQQERFRRRLEHPLRHRKLPPMDLESLTR